MKRVLIAIAAALLIATAASAAPKSKSKPKPTATSTPAQRLCDRYHPKEVCHPPGVFQGAPQYPRPLPGSFWNPRT
jgi:hypothetical protein